MPEKIDLKGGSSRENPQFFAIASVTRARNEGIEVPMVAPMEVCLTINGVEVPFSATVNDIFARMRSDIEEEIAKRATELVMSMKDEDGESLEIKERLSEMQESLTSSPA